MFKKIYDILLSSSLIILLLPFFIFLYLIIIIKLGKPGFFLHERIGKNKKKFKVIKFKSLKNEKNKQGHLLEISERITPFGQLIRKYSMDELPQLFNVIKMDMSIVGPRPLEPSYVNLYSKVQIKRHDVMPGITGLAQIYGRNNITWKKKFQYDIYYVKKKNLCLDLIIIFKTFFNVLFPKGVSEDNHFNKPPFNGKN